MKKKKNLNHGLTEEGTRNDILGGEGRQQQGLVPSDLSHPSIQQVLLNHLVFSWNVLRGSIHPA